MQRRDNGIPEREWREYCTSRGGNNRGSEGLNIWLRLRAFKSGSVKGTTMVTSVLWGIWLFALQWLIYNVPVHSSDDLNVPDQAVVRNPANPLITLQPRTKTHIKPQEMCLIGGERKSIPFWHLSLNELWKTKIILGRTFLSIDW